MGNPNDPNQTGGEEVMMPDCLVDSDIFIDFLRGQSEAVEFIKVQFPHLNLSVISVSELYAGVRDGTERTRLEEALTACRLLEVTHGIAREAGLFKRSFGRSHGVTLPDGLIAATAKEYGLSLATLNKKHFPMLPNVFSPYQKE